MGERERERERERDREGEKEVLMYESWLDTCHVGHVDTSWRNDKVVDDVRTPVDYVTLSVVHE